MKRKIFSVFLVFFILFGIKINLYAENSDMANRIFNGNFKSFFIGKISEMDNKNFIIDIKTTFMGEELETIQVERFNEYTFSSITPKKNDIIVAILKNDNKIDETWVFKATSTNYKTLFLANDKNPENEDVILFQNYINSGTYIEDREATSLKTNTDNTENNLSKNNKNNVLTGDFSEYDEKIDIIFKFLKSPVKLIVIGLIFVVISYVLVSSKNYRKDMEKEDFDEHDYR